jgi:hypothetical protein
MTVKQLNIKSFTNTAVTFMVFPSGSGLGFYFFIFPFSFAQKKEQIGTETVNGKTIHAKIGCFKRNSELDDEETPKKKRLSIPFSLFL